MYRRIKSVMLCAIIALIAYGIYQNNMFIAVVAVTLGMVALHVTRRGLTEVEHDERTRLIRGKAASTTLAISTAAMAVIGLSLIMLSGQGIGDYVQVGYLLAYQANAILALYALFHFYFRNRLGG